MKVLNVIRTMDPKIGGPASGINSLSVGFRAVGHSNDVVTLDDPAAPWIQNSPSKIIALGEPLGWYGYSAKLVKWLRAHAHEYDTVFAHGIWNFPSLACWMALRKTDKPWFMVPHGSIDPWFEEAYPGKQLKKKLYWKLFAWKVMRDCDGTIFTSRDEAERARGTFKPYHCREIVVSYGIPGAPFESEPARAAFFARFPELRGKRVVLLLSRIVKQKGCDILVDAFANVRHKDPNLQLVFAGPDQTGLRADLEKQIAAHGMTAQVTWTDSLAGAEKWGAFYAAEVFALPSHMENFGVAVAEALAAGCPVLISDKVQIWHEIDECRAGIVDTDSVDGMTRQLNKWLDLSDAERSAMRRAAVDCFAARFHTDSAALSWIGAAANAIKERAAKRQRVGAGKDLEKTQPFDREEIVENIHA